MGRAIAKGGPISGQRPLIGNAENGGDLPALGHVERYGTIGRDASRNITDPTDKPKSIAGGRGKGGGLADWVPCVGNIDSSRADRRIRHGSHWPDFNSPRTDGANINSPWPSGSLRRFRFDVEYR